MSAWTSYKGSVYQQLFGNFFEYFRKYCGDQDFSHSAWLEHELGRHRLAFNSYYDALDDEAARFATVLTTRGFVSACCLHATGAVSGGDDGAWRIERDGESQAFPSPLTYVRRQKKFLGGFIERDVTYVIVFDDGTDLTGVRCACPVMHMSELVGFLKGLGGVASEAEIKGAFDAFRLAVANGGTR